MLQQGVLKIPVMIAETISLGILALPKVLATLILSRTVSLAEKLAIIPAQANFPQWNCRYHWRRGTDDLHRTSHWGVQASLCSGT